jgi:isopenicillin N synthase-like dioxygenase
MNSVPTLELSEFDTHPEDFVQALGQTYREWGFAGISGHGVDPEIIERALKAAESLFALPEAIKRQYDQHNGGARGYTPFGKEIALNAKHHDLKEFWHIGREVTADNPYPKQLLPNVWPKELFNSKGIYSSEDIYSAEEASEFKTSMLALYQALDTVGAKILSALALFLGEDRDFFSHKIQWGNSILRPLHYPPLPADIALSSETAGSIRAAAHEDINLITLLVGSKQSGLEVLSRQGNWVPITTVPGALVCNIGDMLQRLTNGVLPSTTHRVVNPKGELGKQSRYSIPFFLHPNPDMSLAALPQCVTTDNPLREPPILAHDYLIKRLEDIGLFAEKPTMALEVD